MDKKLKDGLNSFTKKTIIFFDNMGQTLSSILRIGILSSIKISRQSRNYPAFKNSESCCVLGNGPSLKVDFEKGRVLTEGNDVFCVNMFCSSQLFAIIKPRFYFLVDGAYFAPQDERCQKLVDELIESFKEVDWDLYLVVSSASYAGSRLLKSINNSYIKVIRMNSTTVNGFKSFRHWVYRHRLGMPLCQTVVNFALCAAINMEYKNVYLYGADHTWTRDLFVDDDNVVCYGDRHVYNKNLTVIKKEGNFAHLLGQFAKMFKAHYLLEDYAKSQGVKIWNCASDTYLDAYERLK